VSREGRTIAYTIRFSRSEADLVEAAAAAAALETRGGKEMPPTFRCPLCRQDIVRIGVPDVFCPQCMATLRVIVGDFPAKWHHPSQSPPLPMLPKPDDPTTPER
jgi:hypothetical protein